MCYYGCDVEMLAGVDFILGSSYVLGAVLVLLALVVCVSALVCWRLLPHYLARCYAHACCVRICGSLLVSVASSLGEVLCTRLIILVSLVSYWRRQAEIRGRGTLSPSLRISWSSSILMKQCCFSS